MKTRETLNRRANVFDDVAAPNSAGTRAVAALAALAQETRLAIFRLLVEFAPDGLTAGAIALKLKIPPATLSFHLKELAGAGLLTDRREGRFIWYQADLTSIRGLIGYLTDHCCRATAAKRCVPGCAPNVPRSAASRRGESR